MSTVIYYPNQALFDEPKELFGSPRRRHPIVNDTSAYQIHKSYVTTASEYQPQDLDTVLVDEGNPLYLVEETVTTRTPAFVYFDRLYSSIPDSRLEFESYPFSYPGMSSATTLGTSVAITAGNFNVPGQITLTIGTHGFTTGSILRMDMVLSYSPPFGWSGTPGDVNFVWRRKPVSVTTTTVVVDWPYTRYSFVSGTVRDQTVRQPRSPFTRNTTARLAYDYILPGVTAGFEKGSDIKTTEGFSITNSDGEETDTLSTTTLPTQAEYETYIDDNTYVVAETFVRRWYGNIYERVTRAVRAE